jgi:hypothetical protein
MRSEWVDGILCHQEEHGLGDSNEVQPEIRKDAVIGANLAGMDSTVFCVR